MDLHARAVDARRPQSTMRGRMRRRWPPPLAVAWVAILAVCLAAGDQAANVGLWSASLRGSLVDVKMYLEMGADPNFYWTGSGGSECNFVSDEICGTPLLAAVWRKKAVVLQSLIDAGAEVNRINASKADGSCGGRPVTPLYVAVVNNYTFVTEILLESKADPNIPCDNGAFFPLAVVTNLKILKLLLAANADVDVANGQYEGKTALHRAFGSGSGFEDQNMFARELLMAGACPNIPDLAFGDTALHSASRVGNLEGLKLLLKAEGDPSFRNNDGLAPSDVVCRAVTDQGGSCSGDDIKDLLISAQEDEANPPSAALDCDNTEDPAEKLMCALQGGSTNGTGDGMGSG
eukprot:evm.model.scf_1166.2 EVM.evm.TU.scf_1166.2   scf_1166:34963-38674(+)